MKYRKKERKKEKRSKHFWSKSTNCIFSLSLLVHTRQKQKQSKARQRRCYTISIQKHAQRCSSNIQLYQETEFSPCSNEIAEKWWKEDVKILFVQTLHNLPSTLFLLPIQFNESATIFSYFLCISLKKRTRKIVIFPSSRDQKFQRIQLKKKEKKITLKYHYIAPEWMDAHNIIFNDIIQSNPIIFCINTDTTMFEMK